MCFTCGFLGCGEDFPLTGHIYEHFIEKGHAYCKPMFFITQRTDQVCIFDQTIGDFVNKFIYDAQTSNVFSKDKDKKDKFFKDQKNANKLFNKFENEFETKLTNQMHLLEKSIHERKEERLNLIHDLKNQIIDHENKITNIDTINHSLADSIKNKKAFVNSKILENKSIIAKNEELKQKIREIQKQIKGNKNIKNLKEIELQNHLNEIKIKIKEKLAEVI